MSNIETVSVKRPADGHREKLLTAAFDCLHEKGYARTTTRDLVAASGTNLASIGYHFGGKEALLDEVIAVCLAEWTTRVERELFATAAGTPREMLERALVALLDVFEDKRPMLIVCVESFAPALRSDVLRARLAAAYAETRRAGTEMVRRASAEMGVEPPFDAAAFVSVLIALADGLMIQWLTDPESTPGGRQVLDVLVGLSTVLAPENPGDHLSGTAPSV